MPSLIVFILFFFSTAVIDGSITIIYLSKIHIIGTHENTEKQNYNDNLLLLLDPCFHLYSELELELGGTQLYDIDKLTCLGKYNTRVVFSL
ncbi:hypothetical protein ACJX0J_010465, partial [Zea mays]